MHPHMEYAARAAAEFMVAKVSRRKTSGGGGDRLERRSAWRRCFPLVPPLGPRSDTPLSNAQMLHKPAAEVGLTLFGTSGTRNALTDALAEQGEEGQYPCIEERHA